MLLLADCDDSVLNVFIDEFMRTLPNKIIVFCVRKIKGDNINRNARTNRGSDDFNSEEFKQTVYHIAGSIVDGLLWKGKQYKTLRLRQNIAVF